LLQRLSSIDAGLIEKPNEKHSEDKAEEGADDDFADAVAGAFFEARILFFVDIKLPNEHIEIATLIAKVHPQTRGVVNDQKSQSNGHCKRARVDAFKMSDGGDDGNRKSSVGAWHMAMGEDVADIPTVPEAVVDKFDDLHEDANGNWNEKDQMRRNKVHKDFV